MVQIGYFTVGWKENIHGNKMVVKGIEKHEVYSIILNSYFMLFTFCFVRIRWWLCQNPQCVYLFSQQLWKRGTVFEQGEARIHRSGNWKACRSWSKVWCGPHPSSWYQLTSILGLGLLCSIFSERGQYPEGAWMGFLTWWSGGILSGHIQLNAR